jgi:predicted RNA binding protein YcfA (HicA-like mRNA interferase family)
MVLIVAILVVTIPTMKSSGVIKRLEGDGWYFWRGSKARTIISSTQQNPVS